MANKQNQVVADAAANSTSKGLKLEAKIIQLKALTTILSGDGLEHLRMHDDLIQGNVMWLVADLANEIDALHQETARRY